ncbi:MAG TPA: nuclear transport factor 2 family protein [Candidatus Binataceae bacterium]|nr:nuclear transport factor 2 family protein [Candidatus Binataceae bacterium]
MNTAEMKEAVLEFLKEFEDPDPIRLESMISNNFVYQVIANMPGFSEPIKGKEGMKGFAGTLKAMLPNGLNMKIGQIIAEGDHAAVQCESDTTAANGKKYQNRYHFYFRFEGDKIAEVKEYCDTNHAREVFAS